MKSFLWKLSLFFLIISLFGTFCSIFRYAFLAFLLFLASLIYPVLTTLDLSANIISRIGVILIQGASIIFTFMVCRMVWKILPKEMVE